MTAAIGWPPRSRNLLVFALVTFVITFVASRGEHTRLHHRIARVAMGLEALMFLMALVSPSVALILLAGVAACFLLVYVTDTRAETSRLDYTVRVLKTGWRALTRRGTGHRFLEPRIIGTPAEDGR